MDPLKSPSAPETKLHFLDYWRIIRIRKTVILAVFLLVALTATIVTYFLPASYSSSTRIQVERDTTDVPSVMGQPTATGVYDPYFIQTEFEVIKSQVILDKVIEAMDLNNAWQKKFGYPFTTSRSRMTLMGMIELRPVRNTSLIDITVYSGDPAEAAKIAETVGEVYQTYRKDTRQQLITGGIDAFEKKLDDQDKIVREAETNVDDLRVKLGVTDTSSQNPGATTTMEEVNLLHYNSAKIEAETSYIKEEKVLEELKGLDTQHLREILPTLSPDPILSSLLQNKIDADTALIKLGTDLGESHPDILRTHKWIDELDAKIDDRVQGIMHAMAARVDSFKAVMDKSQEKLDEAKTNDLQMAEKTRPYWMAKADLDRQKRSRELLAVRTFQEQVDKAMPTTAMVRIINHAEQGLAPVKPNKMFNIILGVVIGLVVGVALAFFIEYLDTSVKTIDDVERTLQAPVLGVIPQNVGFLMEEGSESPHAEAYRVLRTNLLFSRKDDKLNTIAVVSAGAGEGKSTTVINLATVFAQGGQRVLMVDSDLRRPTLHKLLQVGNTLGLTNYLLKQNTLEEVIQTTGLGTLDFLPSGKLPSSSLGILSSAQMKDLITELKQRYDFVLFDSPPIMGVSDASILASEVDITLQVIQYRRYPQPMNIRAKQLIEKVGGNLIGIVLNNINMSQDENYYYYTGYYHDYYSKNDDDSPGSNGSGEDKPRVDINPKY